MTAAPEKNPYRPGVSLRPSYLAGRQPAIDRFAAMLRAAPEQQACMRVTGLRGVGKSVLLDVFAEKAQAEDWEAANLEWQPGHNTDQAVREVLGDRLDRGRRRISRFADLKAKAGEVLSSRTLAVTWEDISLELSPGSSREEALSEDLFATVELALAKGKQGLVLLLDEMQLIRDEKDRHGEHPLSLIVAPMVALQRESIPLAVVVCGLPTLAANLQKARSYSERLFRGELVDSLPGDEAADAFVKPLESTSRSAADEVVEVVIDEVEGYPYFIQLWGSELWDAAEAIGSSEFTMDLLEGIRPAIYERLDSDFYNPRMEALTPAEQDLLLDSSSCPYPPLASADLNEASAKAPGNVNVLLGRLVEAGALYRIRKGEYGYTAPKFRDFLQRRVAQVEDRSTP